MALMPELVNVEQIVGPSGMWKEISVCIFVPLFRWVSAIFTFVLGQNCNENGAVNFIFEIPVQYPLVDSCRSVKNGFFNYADCVMQSLLAVIKNISSAWNVKKFRRRAHPIPLPWFCGLFHAQLTAIFRKTEVNQYQNVFILDCIGARMMEVVVSTGALRRAKLQSDHHHQ